MKSVYFVLLLCCLCLFNCIQQNKLKAVETASNNPQKTANNNQQINLTLSRKSRSLHEGYIFLLILGLILFPISFLYVSWKEKKIMKFFQFLDILKNPSIKEKNINDLLDQTNILDEKKPIIYQGIVSDVQGVNVLKIGADPSHDLCVKIHSDSPKGSNNDYTYNDFKHFENDIANFEILKSEGSLVDNEGDQIRYNTLTKSVDSEYVIAYKFTIESINIKLDKNDKTDLEWNHNHKILNKNLITGQFSLDKYVHIKDSEIILHYLNEYGKKHKLDENSFQKFKFYFCRQRELGLYNYFYDENHMYLSKSGYNNSDKFISPESFPFDNEDLRISISYVETIPGDQLTLVSGFEFNKQTSEFEVKIFKSDITQEEFSHYFSCAVSDVKYSYKSLEQGFLKKEEFIEKMENPQKIYFWTDRLLGFLVIFADLLLIFYPYIIEFGLFNYVRGNLTYIVITISFLFSIAIFFIIISFTWIMIRPIMGTFFLILSIGIIIGTFLFAKSK